MECDMLLNESCVLDGDDAEMRHARKRFVQPLAEQMERAIAVGTEQQTSHSRLRRSLRLRITLLTISRQ
jgi:hypothetical protein